MKKRFFIPICLIFILIYSVMLFTACGRVNPDDLITEEHPEHSYKIVTKVSTREVWVKCPECGAETNLYSEVDEGEYDSSPENFEVRENDDGTLRITAYIGDSTKIKFPSKINGKRVSVLDLRDSYDAEKAEMVTSVIISEGIEKIENRSFLKWTGLKSIWFSKGLKELGYSALARTGVRDFYLPDGLEKIGSHQFSRSATAFIYIPSSVSEIDSEQMILWNEMDNGYKRLADPKGFYVGERNSVFSSDENGILYKNGEVFVDPAA